MEPQPQTLLSAVHSLTTNDAFLSSSAQDLHLFAQSDTSPNSAQPHLKDILATASLMSLSLSAHLSLSVSDPKLVSIMRQHAALAQELYTTETQLSSRMKALRERHGVDYGEDLPSKAALIEWFLAQVETWGNSAGMQLFKEPENEGKLGVVIAGKILVLDIEFRVTRDEDMVKIELTALKSSHASPLDAPATSASSLPTSGASLDTFLTATLREYLEELQKDSEDLDAVHIARLSRAMKQHLHYIMKLDSLAQREIEGGSRWFTEGDDLGSLANQVVQKEAETVAKDLALPQAPLDILLLRGHPLPLPYLRTPALSFLVYLPPLCYLTLLRSSSTPAKGPLSFLDISSTALRTYLSQASIPKGLVIANLSLAPSSQPIPTSSHFPQTQGRHYFPLLPPDILDDADFQGLDHILPTDNGPDAWVLDFGQEGVILSQSRMWEIQVLLGLAPASDAMQMMSFGYGGSWVDLVVQGVHQIPHERYTALHVSPTNAHPPLHLRLSSPVEPGFILRKIRVQSVRDIWTICEIVKEQSWYNNLLDRYTWYPEGHEPTNTDLITGDTTEEEVAAVLNGNLTPHRIPVNLVFAAGLFETQIHRANPSLTMVFPGKNTTAPLINASIALDSSRSTSIRVVVNGVTVPDLEEFVRRGGGLGLAGQLWIKTSTVFDYHSQVFNT